MSVTIAQYILFIRDSQRVTSAYENEYELNEVSDTLDDQIYYVKGFGHVTEFLVAIFLFFNGMYILLFESYGTIRTVMICIHAYFHIWVQARKGWSAFVKRRTAIEKLKRLAVLNESSFREIQGDNFSREEFEERLHDSCPICFCELAAQETRITNCKHFFHTICLRKLLYVQDKCPMCQKNLTILD